MHTACLRLRPTGRDQLHPVILGGATNCSSCGSIHRLVLYPLKHYAAGSSIKYSYTADLLSLDQQHPLTARRPDVFQLQKVTSPLLNQLHAWRRCLSTHPDQTFATYILDGLQG